jgi:predicted transcriptional regulator
VRQAWKRRRRGAVPDAELAVLKLLWEGGPATIRSLADSLYPGGEAAQYATVQKLLERLQERGYVARKRETRLNVYRATVGRDDLIRERLRDAADKLCEGSLTPLLTQLVDSSRLSREDIRKLRALVERLERERE